MVPSQVDGLEFHWHSLAGTPNVAYSIHIIHTAGPAMDRPQLVNISATGIVPKVDAKFAVRLPCTGHVSAEVDFLLQVRQRKYYVLICTRNMSLNTRSK